MADKLALKPGWLQRQFSRIENSSRYWPEWMRRSSKKVLEEVQMDKVDVLGRCDRLDIPHRKSEDYENWREARKTLPPCGACRATDERLIAAAARAGITYVGCDTPDALAEELEAERKRRVEAEASVEQLGDDLKAAQMDYANEHKLRVEVEAERDAERKMKEGLERVAGKYEQKMACGHPMRYLTATTPEASDLICGECARYAALANFRNLESALEEKRSHRNIIENGLRADIDLAHKICDEFFSEKDPSNPCSTCRDHSIGYRMARMLEVAEKEARMWEERATAKETK